MTRLAVVSPRRKLNMIDAALGKDDFWERNVETEEELERICDYIHYNPVKHG